MEKLKFNPSNKKYYSEEFIKGFECGVERQFNADMEEKTTINSEKTTITDGDLISRTDLLNKIFQQAEGRDYYGYNMLNLPYVDLIKSMPSAEKPAKEDTAESYEWCTGCKEYDNEKHCCHRYTNFIRYSLQENIDSVLEDIKAEILDETVERVIEIDKVIAIVNKHIKGK